MESSKPKLAVIDYGMGNLRSVEKAFEHEGAAIQRITHADELGEADALVLPGVGALGDCMDGLKQAKLDELVVSWIREDRPFFGICLGYQALFEFSEEGSVKGLGVFDGVVRAFDLAPEYKIPHMGWNAVQFLKETPVDEGLSRTEDQFYFVHSYFVKPADEGIVWSETVHGKRFASGIHLGNCFATQYHPEKSQARGLQMYRNFIQWLNTM